MFINGQDEWAFHSWIELNTAFWGQYDNESNPGDDKAIYVDLFHDNGDYLIRNLLTARLLGLESSSRVIGLTGRVGSARTSCDISVLRVKELAASFGVEVVVFDEMSLDSEFASIINNVVNSSSAGSISGADLREILRDLAIEDDFPIGRYVYDTALRKKLVETIDRLDENIFETGAEILSFREWLIKEFSKLKPQWVVVGHIDYCPWGVLAEVALSRDSQCVYVRNEGQMRLYFLSEALQSGQTLLGKIRQQSVSWQGDLLKKVIEKDRLTLDNHLLLTAREGFYRSFRALKSRFDIPPEDVSRHARAFLLPEFGLKSDRPVVVLFTITFADIARADEQVFSDNFTWLEDTLSFAAAKSELNWIVRVHPYDLFFNVTGAIEKLKLRHRDAHNIAFVDGKIDARVCFLMADIVSTIRGAPGVQAALLGIPTILPGRGFYSDFGFCQIASDADSYFSSLVGAASSLPDFRNESLTAKAYQFCEDVLLNVPTTFVGAFGGYGQVGFWESQLQRLSSYSVNNDPFYVSLIDSINQKHPRLMYFGNSSSGPRTKKKVQLDAVLRNEAHFPFSHKENSDVDCLFGSYGAESWGTWLGPGRAAFSLFLRSQLDGDVTVSIWAEPFRHEDMVVPSLHVTVNGFRSATIYLTGNGCQEYEIELPGLKDLKAGGVFVGFEVEGGASPSAVGLSDDQRQLTVGLLSLRFAVT